MALHRYNGDQPRVFVTVADPSGNGTWLARPGDTIDLGLADGDPVPDGLELDGPAGPPVTPGPHPQPAPPVIPDPAPADPVPDPAPASPAPADPPTSPDAGDPAGPTKE